MPQPCRLATLVSRYHNTAKSVWLAIFRRNGEIPAATYDEAVDEGFCFGWIDSSIAKQPVTHQKRIAEIVTKAAVNERANSSIRR